MDSLNSLPSTALQAKNFSAPTSLSFPGGITDITPPSSEKDEKFQANGINNGEQVGAAQGNGVTPATPAATPAAGLSGIVPTLQ